MDFFYHKCRKLSPALLVFFLACTDSTSPVQPGVDPSVLTVELSSQIPPQAPLPHSSAVTGEKAAGTRGAVSLTVSWTECTDQAFEDYVLYRSEKPDISTDLSGATVLGEFSSPATTSFEDQASLDTEYYYVLRTNDTSQNSAWSNEVLFSTPGISNSVLFLTGISPLSLDLAWTSCRDLSFLHYRLYRSAVPGIREDTTNADLLCLRISFADTVFNDTDFERWSTYYYAVLTTGINGETCWNNEIEVNSQDVIPSDVESTVDVGVNPWDATSPYPGILVYVSNRGEDNVSVIRTSDDTVIGTVTVGTNPYGICSHPSGEFVYTANCGSDDVSVIRTSDNTVVATIEVGARPVDVCVLPSGEFLYVANRDSNTVSIIRTSDNTVVATVDAGTYPHTVCTSVSGEYVYVSNWGSGDISVIRTSDNTVVEAIDLYPLPTGICSSPTGEFVYVSVFSDDTIAIIRSSDFSVTGTLDTGNAPWGVCVYCSGFCIYSVNSFDDTVNIIRLSDYAILNTVQVGNNPSNLCILADGTAVYVVNYGDGTVSVIR